MVTHTHDDSIVRTHEEAHALIAKHAGGMAVRFDRTRHDSGLERTRRFALYHSAHPREPLNAADTYALPFAASVVAERVKTLAKQGYSKLSEALLRP